MAATELQLGPRIRSLRQARQVTLRELAERAGVTESFLSQVEREVTSPSIASVQRIARALDLGIAELFVDEPPLGRVVRRADRRRIVYNGLNAVDEFLTAGRDGRLQVILTTLEPGGGTGDEAYTHESDEEVVIVLEGSLELWVGDEHHLLADGRLDRATRRVSRTATAIPVRVGRSSCSARRRRASDPALQNRARRISSVRPGRRWAGSRRRRGLRWPRESDSRDGPPRRDRGLRARSTRR